MSSSNTPTNIRWPNAVRCRESVFHALQQQELYMPEVTRQQRINSTKDSLDYVQRLGLLCRLPVHTGCVNTVSWSDSGEYLLSGSDDQFVAISNPHNQQVLLKYKTGHRANIFSARFMPQSSDMSMVSCSGDGIVLHTELLAPYVRRRRRHNYAYRYDDDALMEDKPVYMGNAEESGNLSFFNCHKSGTTFDVLTLPKEPRCFLSCGDDGTVRYFDLRELSCCHKTCCKDNILVFSPNAVNAMDVAPVNHYELAVGSADAVVRIYDRRYLRVIDFSDSSMDTKDRHTRPVRAYPIPLPTKRHYRVTCVKYSADERELLASYSSEYLYLFDAKHEGADVQLLQAPLGEMGAGNNEVGNGSSMHPAQPLTAEQVTRRLRLRGDWSDTGPDARPERDPSGRVEIGQVRPMLQANIMSRMTEVIARLLNDPRTRIGLTGPVSVVPATQRTRPDELPSTSTQAWRSAASRSLRSERRRAEQRQREAEQQDATLTVELSELEMDTTTVEAVTAEVQALYSYLRRKYIGHRNARTMIKEANFWGTQYVMSGSDCGHIFMWQRTTGKLVMLMQADQHVVNCLQPHPEFPYLASAGIDYDVKIWAPVRDECGFNEEEAEALMKRNAIMLEETKDTITVPAAFMIRMLACIHSLRNRDQTANNRSANNDTNNNEQDQAMAPDQQPDEQEEERQN